MASPFKIFHHDLPPTDSDAKTAYFALCESASTLSPTGGGRTIDWVANRRASYTDAAAGHGIGGLLSSTYQPRKQDGLMQALHFACLTIEKYNRNRQIYVPELDEDVRDVDRLFHYWRKEGGVEGGSEPTSGFEVASADIAEVLDLFFDKKRPKAAREVIERLSVNVLFGAPMPYAFRALASQVLAGSVPIPKKPARAPSQMHRDTLLAVIAEEIQRRIGLPLGANLDRLDGSQPPPICGATIAGAALTAFRIPVNHRQAVTIVNERKKLPSSEFPRWKLVLNGAGAENRWYLREGAIFQEVVSAVRLLRSPLAPTKS